MASHAAWCPGEKTKVHQSSQAGGYFSSVYTEDVRLDSRERRERGEIKSRMQISRL